MYGNLPTDRTMKEQASARLNRREGRPQRTALTYLLAKAFWLLGGNWDGEQLIGQMTYKRHYL
jgi:hypothetical protein